MVAAPVTLLAFVMLAETGSVAEIAAVAETAAVIEPSAIAGPWSAVALDNFVVTDVHQPH